MSSGAAGLAAVRRAGWGFRLTGPRGALPLGAVFGAIAALGGAAVALLGLDRLPFSVCLFKIMTGLPCPTCGSTRALGHLVHLDWAGALAMNPLATAGFLTVAFWALADLTLLARGRALGVEVGRPLGRALRVAALAALLANWTYLIVAGR